MCSVRLRKTSSDSPLLKRHGCTFRQAAFGTYGWNPDCHCVQHPSARYDLDQTIQALVNANPDVFIDNNANRMLAGKVLNIPNRVANCKRLAASAPAKINTATEKANETANTTEVKTENLLFSLRLKPEAQVKDAGVNTQQQEEVKQASAEQTEQAASAAVNENAASTVPASDVQDVMASDAQENVVASGARCNHWFCRRAKQKANQTAIYGNGYWQAVQPLLLLGCCWKLPVNVKTSRKRHL